MENEKYAREILKTGFVLESKISDALRQAGWTVINNKYYEDDFEGSVREIDLLAYRVTKIQHNRISVYTTLLISCKKSDTSIWALLAKNINLKDPNADWWPLHTWSNDKAITFELSKPSMAKKYHEEAIKLGVQEVLSVPDFEIFAFQEMNRESGKPQNDKNIFNSLTSLMKAQAYELGALPQRKKSASIYQFNLISVIDSDLIRLKFDGEKISESPVDSEHYISRYIIKKNETSSRIQFVKASCFAEKLKDYGRLHTANYRWFDTACNTFYDDILKDGKRVAVLIENFRTKVKWPIYFSVKDTFNMQIDPASIYIGWDAKENIASVTLLDSDVVAHLNGDTALKLKVSAAIKDIYRYAGDFRFAVDELQF